MPHSFFLYISRIAAADAHSLTGAAVLCHRYYRPPAGMRTAEVISLPRLPARGRPRPVTHWSWKRKSQRWYWINFRRRGVKLQLTPGALPLPTQLSEPPLGGTAEYLSDLPGEWERPTPPTRGGQERLSLGLGLPIQLTSCHCGVALIECS